MSWFFYAQKAEIFLIAGIAKRNLPLYLHSH